MKELVDSSSKVCLGCDDDTAGAGRDGSSYGRHCNSGTGGRRVGDCDGGVARDGRRYRVQSVGAHRHGHAYCDGQVAQGQGLDCLGVPERKRKQKMGETKINK